MPRSLPQCCSALAIVALMSGCLNMVMYTETSQPPRALPPRAVGSVQVFTLTPPPQPHTVIGIIQASPPTAFPADGSVHGLLASARTRAAQLGCDAILISSIDQGWGRHQSTSVQAGCVVFTGDAVAASH